MAIFATGTKYLQDQLYLRDIPTVRKFLAENPDKFDAREWLKPAREAAKQICKQRYVEFGCTGQAPKIKPEPLAVVAQQYEKGQLAQVVT